MLHEGKLSPSLRRSNKIDGPDFHAERGCARSVSRSAYTLLRLVCDTAALRCQDSTRFLSVEIRTGLFHVLAANLSSKIMSQTIGFVGVGRMGANMARRLKETGYTITAVFDANAAAAQSLALELGCVAAEELKVVTALSDVIITVVSDDKAMKKIFTGGLLSRAKGKIFINCATVTPAIHVWVEQKCAAKGASSLEACMASSITQARQGSLYLMCGGKPEVFEQVKPVLEKLSASLRYIGTTGKAAQVKALVNMVMNANTAALAEGLGLGESLGLDLVMLREVFSQTGAR